MSNLKVIILAGGSGTRLWPLSRSSYPKQFLQLKEFDNISFFQMAYNRAKKIVNEKDIYVVAKQDFKYHFINQSNIYEQNIIIESSKKDSLGAIALGIMSTGDDDSVYLILSADHIMSDEDRFAQIVKNTLKDAEKSIITFGIKPSTPHMGYGYIRPDIETKKPYGVHEFKEKPSLETAKKYIDDGYYWNRGIFMFSRGVFLDELKKANIDYYDLITSGINENFEKLKSISIDFGLLEHTKNIKVQPLDVSWSDLGSFESFEEYFIEHKKVDKIYEQSAQNNFAIKDTNKEVAFIGVDDLIVVDTKDALLISKKGESSKVKQIIEKLNLDTKYHTELGLTVNRPWGSYTIIDEGVGFKTKRLTVLPGKKLSNQMHYHRSEHWVVVSGTADAIINDKSNLLRKGESIYVPIGTKHRLYNPGKTPLHIIESQIGDYLEEDDIVRYDDEFGRA